jgi:hypothetical protein
MKFEHTRFMYSLKHKRLEYIRGIKITIIFFLPLGVEEDGV